MNKYFKNFILCGEVNYHCLLCKESFTDTSDIDKHTGWEKHRKNQKEQSYFQRYKKDFIYKMEKSFYCEVCNYVIESRELLSKHVKEEKHVALKRNPESFTKSVTAKREKDSVIVKNLALTKNQWNSINFRTCFICNTDFDGPIGIHIGLQSHMINLIQAENVYEEDNKVYRKVSANNFYCFACQNIFPMENLTKHWDDKFHIDKEAKATVGRSQEFEEDVTRKLMESQKDFYNIDIEKKIAGCRRCKKIFGLNFGDLVDHNKRHAKQSAQHEIVFDHGQMRKHLKEFGKKHFITLNRGGSRAYCNMCNVFFSPHLFNYKEHIQGTRHVGFLNAKGIIPTSVMYQKPPYTSKLFLSYITHLYHSGPMKVFWVNQSYCIDTFSFVYVTPIPNKPHYEKCLCFACDLVYPIEEKNAHCQSDGHQQRVLYSSIVTSLPGEFVRELQPNIYHCGYCNQVFPYWINLQKHINSFTHLHIRKSKQLMCHLIQSMFKDRTPEELSAINMLTELKGLGVLG